MIVVKPPTPLQRVVFLAGSIEMGAAVDWQTTLTGRLADLDVVVLNPRRVNWDPSWTQSIDEPKFLEQVMWELDGLDRADLIAMWLEPQTLSPITLLEFGLHARGGRLVVGCPPGFWRRGNVEVVCDRYGIQLLPTFEEFVVAVRGKL